MLKKNLFPFLLLLLSCQVKSQTYWSEDVAEVMYNKCTDCHHSGGIAPFSLMTYSDAYNERVNILSSVSGDKMPPWTADTNYQKYSHERFLSADEKGKILDWINQGAAQGNPSSAPAPPVYNSGRLIPSAPDLSVKMITYTSKATSTYDDYSCFVVPTGLSSGKKIKAIEIVPGNPEIVHHCLVYKVSAGTYSTDTSGFCSGPTGTTDQLIAGYTPGASPTVFPSGGSFKSGVSLTSGDELLFAMHYPAGSAGSVDSTKVNIYFYPDTVTGLREIFAAPILLEWGFCIDSGAIDTISDVYPSAGGLTQDFSLLSVFPHMHLIGQSIESYAITSLSDTIPFIKIPIWDFDWQDFYFFEKILKVPSGSKVYGAGVYNNKPGANPHFPNPSPVRVCSGFNTSDEMFLIYFHLMAYQAGDENINVDSLNNIWLDSMFSDISELNDQVQINLKIFPNPTANFSTIFYELTKASNISAIIYDNRGKLVKKLFSGKQPQGANQLIWDGSNQKGVKVKRGVYHFSMLVNGKPVHRKIIFNK